jgi:phage terminase large subunit
LLEAIRAQRQKREIEASHGGWIVERQRCAEDIIHWFDNYLWTYDPRLVGKGGGAHVQFKLWPKQIDLVLWIKRQIEASEEGLIEKSRDVGASYVCAAVALWGWLFIPGFKATFGSRVEDDVDQKDNPDSIFAKLRIMARRLPPEMMPDGFNWGQHDNYMRLVNPATGATITGEGGKNMGRGGRSTVYFLDEAARVPNADEVEKALSGNTDCVIWVSSVNGMGNLFARKRHSILKPHQIARLHWRDDPRKTEEWAQAKQASFSDPTTWASEYDIDYSASVEGVCIPAAWVESAKRIRALEPRLLPSNAATVGLDVGAGKSKSVAITRRGPIVEKPQSRGQPDTTDTAIWALEIAKEAGARRLGFDAPGVGAGVSSALMKRPDDALNVIAINTGIQPSPTLRWEDGRTSEEMFGNLKAEIWWLCRTALQRTHEHVLFLQGKPTGKEHPLTDLLALPSGDQDSDALCLQLSLVKWERNEKGKIVIEKKEALRRRGIASPDHADALMLTFVEPRGNGLALYEIARQQARAKPDAPDAPPPTYAPGSVEYMKQIAANQAG